MCLILTELRLKQKVYHILKFAVLIKNNNEVGAEVFRVRLECSILVLNFYF